MDKTESVQDLPESVPDRQATHGDYATYCAAVSAISAAVECSLVKPLDHVADESLNMIIRKVARITTGDPNFVDHWLDIAGYATRMAEHLQAGKTK